MPPANNERRYFLNEGDKSILDEVIQWYLHQGPPALGPRGGGPGDGGGGGGSPPEVHLARAPIGGIPAASEGAVTGTGTSSATTGDDTFGSAVCDIYRLVSGVPRRTGMTRTVYNIYPLAVPRFKYVLIGKDKFGTWYITGPVFEVSECP